MQFQQSDDWFYHQFSSEQGSQNWQTRTAHAPIPTPARQPFMNLALQAYNPSFTHDKQTMDSTIGVSEHSLPEPAGPLLGNRVDTQLLTYEYADADQVYVQKTQALPEKYSEYRAVKGDGNCGWRALAYSYCEALLRYGDSARISKEVARLQSLNELLINTGNEWDICELFVDATLDLIREIQAHLSNPTDDAFLVDAFNDYANSSAIITHVKLLTASWMKTHAAEYEQFLSGQTVAEYCKQQIDPVQVEMDHMGLNAMIDVLIKPAGFSVEVSYLDRSPTTEVNVHRFEAATPNSPTLCLLYRPGHYDILYKRPPPITVNRAEYSWPLQTQHNSPLSVVPSEMDTWSTLPGFSLMPSQSSRHNAQPLLKTLPSKFERPEFYPPPESLPLETRPFQNSHHNPAHHLNEDFQPALYDPKTQK